MSSNNVIQFYVDAPLCLCHFETRVLCESNIYITHFYKREIKVIFLKKSSCLEDRVRPRGLRVGVRRVLRAVGVALLQEPGKDVALIFFFI